MVNDKNVFLLTLLFVFLIHSFIPVHCQSLDFGIERHDRFNKLGSWETAKVFSVIDVDNDTLEIQLPNATMRNNSEFPIYARLNFKNHFFMTLGYGVNTSRLEVSGASNYNSNFFEYVEPAFYDLYAADPRGLTLDQYWDLYWDAFYEVELKIWRSNVSYVEEMRQRSIHLDFGYRFFPHKPIRPYIFAGFTYKSKFRKSLYQNLEFDNDFVQNLEEVYSGVSEFRKNYGYFRIGFGFETYRFRAGITAEAGLGYPQGLVSGSTNVIAHTAGSLYLAPKSIVMQVGANLFNVDLSPNSELHGLQDRTDLVETQKFHKSRMKWAIGGRFSSPVMANVTNYGYAGNPLCIVNYQYTPTFGAGDSVTDEFYFEAMTLLDVKRVIAYPKFELAGRYNIAGRVFSETGIAISKMSVDNQTSDFNTRLIGDGTGNLSYDENVGATKIRSGVFRSNFYFLALNQSVGVNVYDGQDFLVNVFAGCSFQKVRTSMDLKEKIPGVNSLIIHGKFHDYWYGGADTAGSNMYFFDRALRKEDFPDPTALGDTIAASAYDVSAARQLQLKDPGFVAIRAGAEVQMNRFTFGFTWEQSLGNIDQLIYNKVSTVHLAFGYWLGK